MPILAWIFLLLSPPGSIRVTVDHLRNTKGHLLISLYNGSDGFPDNAAKAIRKQQVSITGNSTVITFNDLPAGNYAVAILHDENDDGKMNTTWVGLPREGYGFSNNAMGTFGPPSFRKASFAHAGDATTTITIRTRY